MGQINKRKEKEIALEFKGLIDVNIKFIISLGIYFNLIDNYKI